MSWKQRDTMGMLIRNCVWDAMKTCLECKTPVREGAWRPLNIGIEDLIISEIGDKVHA